VSSEFKPWTEAGGTGHGAQSKGWVLEDAEGAVFVDLHKNPERWTGYTSAQGSHKIWEAIYRENCFGEAAGAEGRAAAQEGTCREERVFNRVISGLHASITSHIVADACLRQGASGECEQWGVHWEQFRSRLSHHPQRVENLYFVLMFMLRALIKAEGSLAAFDFDAGNATEAARSR